MESNSYEKIAEEMKMKPSSILFLTDIIGGKLLELSLWNIHFGFVWKLS